MKKSSSLVPLNQKISRQEYYDFINETVDDYSDQMFTEEEVVQISRYLQKMSTGASVLSPMICTGPACPFADRCPLQQINKAPIGKGCLIEVELHKFYFTQYMEEYNVDPTAPTDVGYCNELAEIELLQRRLNMMLAKPGNVDMMIDQMVGATNDGTPIIQKQISPYMEQKEKLNNRKTKIIKLMVGDRQEKYKKEAALKQKAESDTSVKMAAARKQLETLQRSLNTLEGKEAPALAAPKNEEPVTITPEDLISGD